MAHHVVFAVASTQALSLCDAGGRATCVSYTKYTTRLETDVGASVRMFDVGSDWAGDSDSDKEQCDDYPFSMFKRSKIDFVSGDTSRVG